VEWEINFKAGVVELGKGEPISDVLRIDKLPLSDACKPDVFVRWDCSSSSSSG